MCGVCRLDDAEMGRSSDFRGGMKVNPVLIALLYQLQVGGFETKLDRRLGRENVAPRRRDVEAENFTK